MVLLYFFLMGWFWIGLIDFDEGRVLYSYRIIWYLLEI